MLQLDSKGRFVMTPPLASDPISSIPDASTSPIHVDTQPTSLTSLLVQLLPLITTLNFTIVSSTTTFSFVTLMQTSLYMIPYKYVIMWKLDLPILAMDHIFSLVPPTDARPFRETHSNIPMTLVASFTLTVLALTDSILIDLDPTKCTHVALFVESNDTILAIIVVR